MAVMSKSGLRRSIDPPGYWLGEEFHAGFADDLLLPEGHRRRWSFYSMLPNLGIDVFPDQMDFFQVLPRGPGK